MTKPPRRLPALLLLAVLALALARLCYYSFEAARTSARLDSVLVRLADATAQREALEKEARATAGDAAFFAGFMALHPENKAYLRTQKAITEDVAALRAEAGQRLGGKIYIVVDTRANKLYLKKGLRLLWSADCSVGKGGLIKDKKSGRSWLFATPRGELRVLTKIDDPAWIKPDWAFVEAGEKVPPPGDPLRKVEGELGKYALNIGDGYLIHGTKNEEALGRPVSHGCIRLGAEPLEKLYKAVPTGTKVYIY